MARPMLANSTNLSWTAGNGATSHDVYFGTDSTPDATEFRGNQAGTTFDPGTLTYSTTYYWQVDEVNTDDLATGNTWSFTTEAAPTLPTFNIDSVSVITEPGKGPRNRGVATIVVHDASGVPVEDGAVSGTFSSDWSGSWNGTTDGSG